MNFLLFIFSEKIKIKPKTPQTFFLMLEAKNPNSRTTVDSFSIKLSRELEILNSSFDFKQMEM